MFAVPTRPNIALFVLDSARADWVRRSPSGEDNFCSLSKEVEGEQFDFAHAHSITSASSMGSLATGLHPFKHGLLPATSKLSNDIPTVAERLSDSGYQTIGVSANTHFSPHTNLDRGFDVFRFLSSNPRQALSELGFVNAFRFGLKIRSESAGLDPNPEKHTVTPLMNKLVKQSVEAAISKQSPFFLLAQYIEPHSPYYPPLKLLSTTDLYQKAKLAYHVHDEMYERMADGCLVSDEEWNALKEMYSLEIAYTADRIAEVISFLDRATDRETIIVVTADHGDLFGEQGFLFHGQPLHDKLTHVPLLMRGVEVQNIDAPTTHVDLIHTLVEIAGGLTDGLDGIDLRSDSRDRFVTQRPYHQDYALIREHNPDYENEYTHEEPATAFHLEGYKMSVSADRTMFFDLKEDPREETILDPEEVPVRRKLEDWADNWFAKHGDKVKGSDDADLDKGTKEHLKNMGYI